MRLLEGLVVVVLLLAPASALSQQSRCADCHFANPTAPAADHAGDWDRSAHRRANIGCEACHGGDSSTFEVRVAHRAIENSERPTSPTNGRNISATCGRCHAGPLVAFQASRHFALLEKGASNVPGCTTCHGAAGFRRQSPKALEVQCRQCHGARGIAPLSEVAESARAMYEALNETRDVLRATRPLIKRVHDKARRERLQTAHQQAEAPLVEAVQAGHQFVYASLKERLTVSRQRLETMLGELANPRP